MRFAIDVHLHSRYARATSRDLIPENLHRWSALKGITVVGTGDYTHPAWFGELREKLEAAEEGLFRLKPTLSEAVDAELPTSCRGQVRFMLSVEISSIYKKNGRTRKIHNVVILPDFDAVERLNSRLGTIGNLNADGRPILGLDSRDLLEICLEVCAGVVFIPAHIWTPHFAALGSSSGFDSMEECFEDLLPHIYAVETGLSSDPPMNWRLSALDAFAIVSNSDAHSPQKLAREATCFDTDLSYPAICSALKERDPKRFTGTLEFFPEEGKYHYDGHRKCGLRWKPAQTLAAGGICPRCGHRLTVGVLHRVELLADRPEGAEPEIARPCEYLIPLTEIIGGAVGVGPQSKKVGNIYEKLLAALGPELEILRSRPVEAIARCDEPLVAEGVRRMRSGELEILPGYDGEYGTIQIFSDAERERLRGQAFLFDLPAASAAYQGGQKRSGTKVGAESSETTAESRISNELDHHQRLAVEAECGPVVVAAGPGSGKTLTLTRRIAHLIRLRRASPARILAVTFTKRAAAEMRERLAILLPAAADLGPLSLGTFHRIALDLLKTYGTGEEKTVVDAVEARRILAAVLEDENLKLRLTPTQEAISLAKAAGRRPEDISEHWNPAYSAYQERLRAYRARDYDDILLDLLDLLEGDKQILDMVRARFLHVLVDEFQDVNAVQYRLVQLFAGAGQNLFVIGDPDQAIYGFRGADPRYFGQLKTDFPAARYIHLQSNYRSSGTIVKAATALLQRPSVPAAARDNGIPVRLVSAPGETSEGIAVVREISRMVGGADMVQSDRRQGAAAPARSFGDFGVLVRTGRQAEVVEECFLQEGLPYRLAGNKSFLEAESVRAALAFSRYVLHPHAGLRLLHALEWRVFHPGAEALSALRREPGVVPPSGLSRDLAEPVEKKRQLLDCAAESCRPVAASQGPAAFLRHWQKKYGPGEDADLEKLIRVAESAPSLEQLLDTVMLGLEADYERTSGPGIHSEAVQLMTLHAAKGLEFPVVFICGVEEGLIPFRDKGADLEEERRLFYVGLTRARDEVVLLRTRHRMRYGKRLPPKASPFLQQIPAHLLREEQVEWTSRPERAEQLSLF